MLSFKQLQEKKKTAVLINPKINDLKEADKNHGEDCDCMKCEKKRMKGGSEKEVATESAVPGKPAERLGAVTAIPKDERDAARERTLAKAKAARAAREKGMKEEVEIEEGMTLKDFKKKRSAQKQKDKRAAEKTSPLRRAGIHDDKASPERAARHRANVDPDYDHDDEENMYPGGKLKNPKKIRKAKAVGEITKEEIAYDRQEEVSKEGNQGFQKEETSILTFSDYITERARNAYAIGMASAMRQTGDTPPLEKSTITKAHKIAKAIKKEEVELDEGRAEDAQASLSALRKRQSVLDAHEKKTGKKLDITKTPEHKAHKKNFPGSRQAPKVKGAKETPSETQNRRVKTYNQRILKHGKTTKQSRDDSAMAKHTSARD